jgi:hypothetical protein
MRGLRSAINTATPKLLLTLECNAKGNTIEKYVATHGKGTECASDVGCVFMFVAVIRLCRFVRTEELFVEVQK